MWFNKLGYWPILMVQEEFLIWNTGKLIAGEPHMQGEDMLFRVQILQKTQTKLFVNGKGLMLIEAEVQEVHFLLVIKKKDHPLRMAFFG